VSGDGGRYDAHERHGDVRDDIGERNAQYFAVHGHNGCKDSNFPPVILPFSPKLK